MRRSLNQLTPLSHLLSLRPPCLAPDGLHRCKWRSFNSELSRGTLRPRTAHSINEACQISWNRYQHGIDGTRESLQTDTFDKVQVHSQTLYRIRQSLRLQPLAPLHARVSIGMMLMLCCLSKTCTCNDSYPRLVLATTRTTNAQKNNIPIRSTRLKATC